MDFYHNIMKLYSISDDDNNGYSEDTIIELENNLKIKLPKILRDYYLHLGKRWDINEVDMILFRLDGTSNIHDRKICPYISSSATKWELLYGPVTTNNEEFDRSVQELTDRLTNSHITHAWDSGYLIFCSDIEKAFSWRIKISDLNKDNPKVSAICNYPGYTDSRWDDWNEIFELDKFLLEMAYWNGAFGGLRYFAISDRKKTPIDNNTVKIIEKNWKEVKEISKNALRHDVRYFTNDNTEILWFGEDQLYIGTSNQIKMYNILKMFDLKWYQCRSN